MNGNDVIEKQKAREDIVTEVREKYPDINWPSPVLEPIFYGRLDKNPITGRKLILDKNTGNQFDIVSDQYEMIYHEEVLHNLLKAVPDEFGDPKIKVSMFKNGARANFTTTFPDLKQFELKGSATEVEYHLKNSYDRSSFLNYSYGVKELVCSNGLRAFREKERLSAKHIGRKITSFQLGDKIKNSLERISESHKIWLKWSEMKLAEHDVISFVEALPYSKKEQETLLALPILNHENSSLTSLKNKATVWSVMSAGTQMVHEIKSEERKLDIEDKIPGILQNLVRKAA